MAAGRPSFVEAAVAALLFLIPVVFYRGTEEIFEVPKVALLVTGALVLTAWGLALVLGRPATLAGALGALRRDPIGIGVLAYLASCALSTLASPNPAESFFGAPESTAGLRTALATTVVYFAARSAPGTAETFDRWTLAAGLAAAWAAGYGLLQVVGLDPLDWGRTASFGARLRVFGTMGHPNFLGGYLAIAFPLLLHAATQARSSGRRLAWGAVAALSAVALAATLSRGAWIGFAAGVSLWLLLRWRAAGVEARENAGPDAPVAAGSRSRKALLAAGAVGVVLVVALSPVGRVLGDRLRDLVDPRHATTQTRVHIWAAGLRMAADHPWLGVGLDQFGAAYPAYRTAAYWRLEWGATPAKAHNEAIQILATQGWIGALAALAVVLLVSRASWRALRSRSARIRAAAAASTAALAAFAAQDLVSFTTAGLGVLATALAAWLGAATGPERAPAPARSRRPAWAFAIGLAFAVAAFVPLVARPFQAQRAERRATLMPDPSRERARWHAEAGRLAPWDARYSAKQAFSLYRLAQGASDSSVRRALLAEARAASRIAVGIDPASGIYRTNLGEILTEEALLAPPAAAAAEAESTLRRAFASDTANGQIHDRIAFALARLGRKGEARRVALETARIYPDLAAPLGLLGWMALGEDRLDDGIDTLRLALARDWHGHQAARASTWNNLAVGCLRARRYEEARDAASEALRLDPSLAAARTNLAIAEGALGAAPATGAIRP